MTRRKSEDKVPDRRRRRSPNATDSEYLGEYSSVRAFIRATLEPLLPTDLRWLLDCLDHARVLDALTAGGRDHLRWRDGHVYLDRSPR